MWDEMLFLRDEFGRFQIAHLGMKIWNSNKTGPQKLLIKNNLYEKENIKPGIAGGIAGRIKHRLRAAAATCSTGKAACATDSITMKVRKPSAINRGFSVAL